MSLPARYLYITPEIGALVRDHAGSEAKALYERYIAYHRPTWYLTWGPLIYDYWETSVDHPMSPWATFSARAFLFADAPAELRGYMDIPWCRADLYHIQKLALLATKPPERP